MPERVFLHVGSPKTGTTFLQNVLWSGRQVALEHGLLLPLGTFHDHFLASVDLRELSMYGQFPPRAIGIFQRLAEEALAWQGDVLVSHELFAGATAAQAKNAVTSFGDADVHVIVTARDLERQIPAEWQEHIKHRSTATFSDFVHDVRANARTAQWFWRVQDTASVCRRWGAALPAGNVHVVTVPQGAVDSRLLWWRFAELIGMRSAPFDLSSTPANTSLHAEQAELLRRVNAGLGARLPMPGSYPQAVKDVLAQPLLAGRPGTPIGLVGDDRAYAVSRSQRIVDELRELQVDVVGDLAELVPPEQPDSARTFTGRPDATPDPVLLAESLEALSGLLDRRWAEAQEASEAAARRQQVEAELVRCRGELAGLQNRYGELEADRDRLRYDMRHRPIRHLVIGISEAHPPVMKVRVAYWRTVNAFRRVARRLRRAP